MAVILYTDNGRTPDFKIIKEFRLVTEGGELVSFEYTTHDDEKIIIWNTKGCDMPLPQKTFYPDRVSRELLK